MKHLFLTAFIAIFGVYALGLTGVLEMPPMATPSKQEVAKPSLSFTERIAAAPQTRNSHKQSHDRGYTLKAMR